MRDIEIIEYELRNASPETRKAVMSVKAELGKNERLRELLANAWRIENTYDDICSELSCTVDCRKCPCYPCDWGTACQDVLLRYVQTGETGLSR